MSKEPADRKCITDGEVKEKENLLRFTITPDAEVVPDFKKKLSGRGVYVSCSKKALERAVEKGLFTRAFKQKVKVDKSIIDVVENILKKNGLESISLAKKAGVLVTGFEKVKEALKKNKIAFVLEANDAGDDGHNKIISMAKNLEVFVLYATEELDKTLDRVNTVHAALFKSDMADMVRNKLKKFETFLNS